jgi:hypothetical protein
MARTGLHEEEALDKAGVEAPNYPDARHHDC